MTEKFTPGEWRAEDFNEWDIAGVFIVDKEDNPIAKMCERFVMTPMPGRNFSQLVESKEEQEANTNLIAAAPKMYSLLKLARHEFEAVAEWCDEHDLPDDARGYRNLANGILDVLKQARGEE